MMMIQAPFTNSVTHFGTMLKLRSKSVGHKKMEGHKELTEERVMALLAKHVVKVKESPSKPPGGEKRPSKLCDHCGHIGHLSKDC